MDTLSRITSSEVVPEKLPDPLLLGNGSSEFQNQAPPQIEEKDEYSHYESQSEAETGEDQLKDINKPMVVGETSYTMEGQNMEKKRFRCGDDTREIASFYFHTNGL